MGARRGGETDQQNVIMHIKDLFKVLLCQILNNVLIVLRIWCLYSFVLHSRTMDHDIIYSCTLSLYSLRTICLFI